MGVLTYTRNYNILTLTIPSRQKIVSILPAVMEYYRYYTLKVERNGQKDSIQSVDTRTYVSSSVEKEIKGYTPFETYKITVTWYLDTTTNTKDLTESFTYIWPFDGHILLGGKGDKENEKGKIISQYLPLLYNPEVTNLKWNYIDTITPTLGGSYPVVTRNGQQKYRTFTLGGMISYEMDLPQQNLFSGYQFISEEEIKAYRDLSNSVDEQDLLIERHFRDAAAAWLQNGQKKVFQSEQEGTMIVYLSNFSWTSNKTLGRHSYSFSCTATEIEEATVENIEKVLT